MPQKEGGYGWLIVLIAFVYSIVSNGIQLTFGIMIPTIANEFNCTTTKLVTVGSVAFGLNYLPAFLVCPLAAMVGCRKVAVIGGVLCAISCALSGFVTNCDHLLLTYGILGGISFGLFFLPAEVMVNLYFDKRRAIAHSILACGTAMGILISSPLMTWILTKTSVQTLFFIISGITGVCGLFGLLLVNPTKPENEEDESSKERNVCSTLKDLIHSMADKQVVGNGGFLLFIAARASWRWGMVIVMMILPTYLKENGLESSADLTVSLLGLGILLARLSSTMAVWCPNQAMYIFVASALVGGTSAALMPLCQTATHYYIIAIVYGYCVGPLVALDSVAIVQLIGPEKVGSGLGWTNTMDGISSIVGPPIFGALFGDAMLTYQFYACGGLFAFSTVAYLVICIVWTRKSKSNENDN